MSDDFDICSSRHGGNTESEAAFKGPGKKKFRYAMASRIRQRAEELGAYGVTGNEMFFYLGGNSGTGASKCSISGPGARLSEMSYNKYGPELLMVPIGLLRPTYSTDGARITGKARVYVTPFYHYLMRIAGDPAALYVRKKRTKE